MMVRTIERVYAEPLTDHDTLWERFRLTIVARIEAARNEAETSGETVWQTFDTPLVIAEAPPLPIGIVESGPTPPPPPKRMPRESVVCPCGVVHYELPSLLKHGWGRHCSRACADRYRPKGRRTAA